MLLLVRALLLLVLCKVNEHFAAELDALTNISVDIKSLGLHVKVCIKIISRVSNFKSVLCQMHGRVYWNGNETEGYLPSNWITFSFYKSVCLGRVGARRYAEDDRRSGK
jgi:hypothetical protein